MTFLYKNGHFPTLKVDELSTKSSVLIASQGKEKFTMVFIMGDEVIAEGTAARYGWDAHRKFEDMIARMVGEELEKQRKT
jgi:hypothetical protein